MARHETVQQLPIVLGLLEVSTRIKKVCLLRSLTWDILICFVDVDLTGLSVVVWSRMACRGTLSQLPNTSFKKVPFGGLRTCVTLEKVNSDSYGAISANDARSSRMPCDDSVSQIGAVVSYNQGIFNFGY